MTKIYLIRHAESIANTQGIYQGQSYDSNLSPLGIKQAEALGKRCALIPIDAVYTSPLRRARRTAEAVKRYHVGSVDIIPAPEILETNHGEWEGKSKTEIASRWPKLLEQWQTTPSVVQFPGGEHFRDTATRVVSWFKSVVTSEQTVAVVTHMNVIQILLTHIRGVPLDDVWRFPVGATSVTLVETHSPLTITIEADMTHIVGLESDLAKHAI